MVFSRVSELTTTAGTWRDWNDEDNVVSRQDGPASGFALASVSHSTLNSPTRQHPYFGDSFLNIIQKSDSSRQTDIRKRYLSPDEANRLRVIKESRPSVVS